MLGWLRKHLAHHLPAVVKPRGRSPVSVTFSEDDITVTPAGGTPARIAWAEITSVTILTTDKGPAETDLAWLISPRDRHRSILVPMGADGEHELLHAMQERLAGFDNVAVIEAMGTTTNASFPVWEVSGAKRQER